MKCISRLPLPEKLEDDQELLGLYTGDMPLLSCCANANCQGSALTGRVQNGALGARPCLLTAKWERYPRVVSVVR